MLPIVGLEEGAGFEPAAGGSPVQVVPAPDFKSGGFSLSPNPPVRQGGPRGSRTLRGTVDEAPPGKPAWPASLDGAAPLWGQPLFVFPSHSIKPNVFGSGLVKISLFLTRRESPLITVG